MKINTKSITASAFAIAVMCVLSPLAIYIGPVPLTFSLFALYVISLYFPVAESVIIVSSYIMLGSIGLPVFSGYASGVSVLFGLTGGYIWSYVIVSLFVSYFSKLKNSKIYYFVICFVGLIICYLAGTLQYCTLTNNSFYNFLNNIHPKASNLKKKPSYIPIIRFKNVSSFNRCSSLYL